MARARAQRYASVAAFREDVRACLENRPVSAAPDLPWQRAARWARRNRRNVGVAAASAAAVTLLAGAGLWTQRHLALRGLIADASQALRKAQAAPARARDGEAQAAQRSLLFQAIDPLRRALERAPRNRAARGLLAEANMELWRLSLAEGNAGLMRTARAEVERYAPSPSPYRDELEGKGSLELALSPPETQAWLFRFETLSARTVSGRLLPARLVPVPYDHGHGRADAAFLQQEERRDEQPLPPGARSVYRLEPTAASHLGSGRIQVSALAPGSYLLLLRGQGVETRVPLVMPRGGRVVRAVAVPPPAAVPDGFVFVAGGEAVVGGDTAGAPPPHTVRVAPALLARAEVSMGEYAAFLADLVRLGRRDEAHARLPRDFGVGLQRVVRTAALTSAGRLVPEGAAPAAAEAYAASPARGVSHGDATAYVRWRSGRDGLPYRLPREWEWEAGCRGADGRRYAWGDRAGPGAASQGYGGGAGTGWSWRDRKDESPWGLLNMAGGVGEWTSSPYDTQAVPGQPAYGQLAIRGNAWSLSPVGLECAFRTSGRPDYFHPTIGFRLALDYPPGGAAR
jgi:formylglycine-generating enzyme required for sulfatase activity